MILVVHIPCSLHSSRVAKPEQRSISPHHNIMHMQCNIINLATGHFNKESVCSVWVHVRARVCVRVTHNTHTHTHTPTCHSLSLSLSHTHTHTHVCLARETTRVCVCVCPHATLWLCRHTTCRRRRHESDGCTRVFAAFPQPHTPLGRCSRLCTPPEDSCPHRSRTSKIALQHFKKKLHHLKTDLEHVKTNTRPPAYAEKKHTKEV